MGSRSTCIECGHEGTDCIDSRPAPLGRRRRMRCRECGAKWTTIEVHHDIGRTVADVVRHLRQAELTLSNLRMSVDFLVRAAPLSDDDSETDELIHNDSRT